MKGWQTPPLHGDQANFTIVWRIQRKDDRLRKLTAKAGYKTACTLRSHTEYVWKNPQNSLRLWVGRVTGDFLLYTSKFSTVNMYYLCKAK
jgi:hypothetical protein